jgi:hypothetical protein
MSRWSYALDLEHALNVPQSDPNTIAILAWMKAEGTSAKFNPLATTQTRPGSTTLPGNSAGVQEFKTWADGVSATAQTVKAYPSIVSALQAQDPQQVAVAVGRSGAWGSDQHLIASIAAGWGNGHGGGVIQAIGYGGSTIPGAGGGSIGVGDIPVVGGIVNGVANTATSVASFLGALTERSTWLRIAEIVAGLALGLGGLFLLGRILIAEQAGSLVGTVAKGALSRGS